MKKLVYILTAALLTGAAVSCDKDSGRQADKSLPEEEEHEVQAVAVAVADFLAAPASETVVYELTGKVENLVNLTYGYFNLTDFTGSVYIYGLTATDLGYGAKNDKSFEDLSIENGDIIRIRGYRSYFNSTPQMNNAWFIERADAVNPITTKEATELASQLSYTSSTEYEKSETMYIKGRITDVGLTSYYINGGTFGNASFDIASDETPTYEIHCFRILYLGNQKYTDGQRDIKIGDKVVICGKLMNFDNRLIQTVSGEAYLYSFN